MDLKSNFKEKAKSHGRFIVFKLNCYELIRYLVDNTFV